MTTDRAERLLEAIRKNPRGSYREWAKAAGISSTSVVGALLLRLAAEGKIRLDPGKARSVELVDEVSAEEWRELARRAVESTEAWRERAIRAEKFAAAWKASAKGWRAVAQIECVIEDIEPHAQQIEAL